MPSPVNHSVLTINKKGQAVTHAACPEHGKKSTHHLGVQQDFEGNRFDCWRCAWAGGHSFLSIPVKGAPTDYDSLRQWIADQQYEEAVGVKASVARKAGA